MARKMRSAQTATVENTETNFDDHEVADTENTTQSNEEIEMSEETLATEAEVSPADTETEAAEAAQSEAGESKPAEPDYSAFEAAVAEAVELADESTGVIPEAAGAKVTAEYRALEGRKAKEHAKNLVNDQMREAVTGMNIFLARKLMNIGEQFLVAGSTGTSAPRTPADPTEAFVLRVATLTLAQTLVEENVPEGVSDEWASKAGELVTESLDASRSYLQWLTNTDENKGDEPEATPVVKAAAKLSVGKSARAGASTTTGAPRSTFSGTRGDIGEHIREAFADKESGAFMKVGEIKNFKSEAYGDRTPSAGAITARLFPDKGECNLNFVTPGQKDGVKGAFKN
jgi:hypothetical protein